MQLGGRSQSLSALGRQVEHRSDAPPNLLNHIQSKAP